MPVTYRFDGKIVIVELAGAYTMEDLRASLRSLADDPARPSDASLLINLTESRSISERSSAEVKEMAGYLGSVGSRFTHKIALVAPDDLKFGLARMGSVGAEERGITSKVFRTFEEARAWLVM